MFLHALHVHLQSRQEHDIAESDASEQFERVVTFQNVQAVLADKHTCQHHANDVRDTQFTHDNWGKQNDAKHDEEYQRRVCNWKHSQEPFSLQKYNFFTKCLSV